MPEESLQSMGPNTIAAAVDRDRLARRVMAVAAVAALLIMLVAGIALFTGDESRAECFKAIGALMAALVPLLVLAGSPAAANLFAKISLARRTSPVDDDWQGLLRAMKSTTRAAWISAAGAWAVVVLAATILWSSMPNAWPTLWEERTVGGSTPPVVQPAVVPPVVQSVEPARIDGAELSAHLPTSFVAVVSSANAVSKVTRMASDLKEIAAECSKDLRHDLVIAVAKSKAMTGWYAALVMTPAQNTNREMAQKIATCFCDFPDVWGPCPVRAGSNYDSVRPL